jgi:hypothetical protein
MVDVEECDEDVKTAPGGDAGYLGICLGCPPAKTRGMEKVHMKATVSCEL